MGVGGIKSAKKEREKIRPGEVKEEGDCEGRDGVDDLLDSGVVGLQAEGDMRRDLRRFWEAGPERSVRVAISAVGEELTEKDGGHGASVNGDGGVEDDSELQDEGVRVMLAEVLEERHSVGALLVRRTKKEIYNGDSERGIDTVFFLEASNGELVDPFVSRVFENVGSQQSGSRQKKKRMDQQQIDAVILGSTIRPFESFIGQLMSAANEQRYHAALLFNHFREHHPDTLVLKLTVVLHASTAIDLRAMSAILLRELITHSDDSHSDAAFWPRLPEPSQVPPHLRPPLGARLIHCQEATTKEALKLLVELAGAKARFIAYQKFGGAIIFMLQIDELDRHEEGTRHLAIEFIITLVEELAPKLFDVHKKMLLDLEDDLAWYIAEVQDENAKETSN
ncbi:hypothetical protein ZIOFF_031085 [Zingiber officinale]|uniref:Uncharacterized protein n=1 Tax=Zingiber officinale TaxID=94328 RepID=A0A8J5GYW3_ZINOF|nr:hypothetical protein ZIOFF_031085 [Zingiber officinale]